MKFFFEVFLYYATEFASVVSLAIAIFTMMFDKKNKKNHNDKDMNNDDESKE